MPAPTSEVPGTTRVLSVRPVTLAAPDRGTALQIRISAPADGTGLPVIVFAHGFGRSMNSYDPLVDHWTANGFVVIQPTFLDSATLGITPADSRYPTIWQTRVDDLVRVIDELDILIAAVPGLTGRANTERLAVAGHSWGGQSVGMLLGARVVGADGLPGDDRSDSRVKAGVLLANTGIGGDDLSDFAKQNFAFMSPDFSQLEVPTLVIAGDKDQSLLSTRGPDWFTDVYHLSPGAQHLVTLVDGEHSLGGIHAYGATSTTDESPERVDLVRRSTTAFLKSSLGVDAPAWSQLAASSTGPVARIESKQA